MNEKKIQKYMTEFWTNREWIPHRTPKNLCMALAVEVGELMELFQWVDNKPAQDILNEKLTAEVKSEIADVFSYLLQLADILNIDLEEAFWEKAKEVAKKYPLPKTTKAD